MNTRYKAMEVSAPGTLTLVERETPTPQAGEVLIAVEACGICGADLDDIERANPKRLPRVPGHEVIGRIAAIGPGVSSMWTLGQRVGVGRLGGHCTECEQCRRGQFVLCPNQPVVGATCGGGYAEMMLARQTGLVSIPDDLRNEDAAPILCAGVATFNALKKCGAEAGDLVAVHGVGGLGHMALQYARRMGFKVAAVGRGSAIAADAMTLGAHVYIDSTKDEPAAVLQRMGGAQAIVTTVGNPDAVAALMAGLAPQGRLVVLAASREPLPIATGFTVRGERSVVGSITGTPYEIEKALNFSVLSGVRPMIETMPLERANDACQRLKSGDATFRIVLTAATPAESAPAD